MNKLKLTLPLTLGLILGGCSGVDEHLLDKVESELDTVFSLQIESNKITADDNYPAHERYKLATPFEYEIIEMVDNKNCEFNNSDEKELCKAYNDFMDASSTLSSVRLINYDYGYKYLMLEIEALTIQTEAHTKLRALIKEYK